MKDSESGVSNDAFCPGTSRPIDRRVSRRFWRFGSPCEMANALGRGPDHFLDQIVDPLGRPFTSYQYDPGRRITALVDGRGNRAEVSSDVGARTETVTDAELRLTTISTFDERGNLVSLDEVFDGQSHVTTFTYNDLDLETSRTDPLGNAWLSAYDGEGNLGGIYVGDLGDAFAP